jgi:hypothetical protein
MKPKRKAVKGEQLTDPLQGELAIYQKVGIFQRDCLRVSISGAKKI